MRTKEEYYEDTLKNRALLESQEVLDCIVLTDAANGTGSAANV